MHSVRLISVVPPPPGDEVRSDEYNSDFSLEELSDDEGAKAEKERAGLLQAQDSTYGIIPHSGTWHTRDERSEWEAMGL